MNAIRIRRRIDSETLHLPQVRPLIGRDVEIIIIEEADARSSGPMDGVNPDALASLAAAQGNVPVSEFDELLGGWPLEERADGFEDELTRRRNETVVPPFREP